jgi:hypothetical protein
VSWTSSSEYNGARDYFSNLGYDINDMDTFEEILDVILADAFRYGQENGIEDIDTAITEYIRKELPPAL